MFDKILAFASAENTKEKLMKVSAISFALSAVAGLYLNHRMSKKYALLLKKYNLLLSFDDSVVEYFETIENSLSGEDREKAIEKFNIALKFFNQIKDL